MFLNPWTNKSTQTYLDKIEKLKEKLRDCDAIVIGAELDYQWLPI